MKRKVNEKLKKNILEILKMGNRDIFFWEEFYKFSIISYNEKVENRFSISELHKFLKDNNIINISEIIQIYFHNMSFLAFLEGETLYGDSGFYI